MRDVFFFITRGERSKKTRELRLRCSVCVCVDTRLRSGPCSAAGVNAGVSMDEQKAGASIHIHPLNSHVCSTRSFIEVKCVLSIGGEH